MESGHLEGVPTPVLRGWLLTAVLNHLKTGIILQDTVMGGWISLSQKSFGFESLRRCCPAQSHWRFRRWVFPPDLSTNERTFHVNSICSMGLEYLPTFMPFMQVFFWMSSPVRNIWESRVAAWSAATHLAKRTGSDSSAWWNDSYEHVENLVT